MKRILFIALLLVPLFLHSQEKTETKIDDTYFGLRFGNAYSEKEIRSQMEQEGEHNTSRVSVPISSFMFSQHTCPLKVVDDYYKV